ncbi:MAG: hypothetical protein JWL77_2987 [Chthonomonadaceae bacterium]|nr:hypothetical protein [Chthonomonadaceae bacterium]
MRVSQSTLILLAGLLLVGPIECRPRSSVRPLPTSELLAGHWDGPLHPSAPVSQAIAKQRAQDLFKKFRRDLNSDRPFQEVDIPLTLRGYRPYVQANWSGRKLDCMVDTGSYFISWPQWLQLDTQQLGVPWSSAGPEGPPIPGEMMVSPRIQIGNLTLINMMTEATGVPKPSPLSAKRQMRMSGVPDPILGIYAFVSCVFTIDYRHNKLILRNRDYDVTRLPKAPHTLLVPYEEDIARRVILPGTLAGHPARFMLDTGSVWMCASAEFARKNLGYVPKPGFSWDSVYTSHPSPPVVRNVATTLVGKPFKIPNLYVAERTGNVDVMLGAAFFYGTRVTIDPVRKVVLLERNP